MFENIGRKRPLEVSPYTYIEPHGGPYLNCTNETSAGTLTSRGFSSYLRPKATATQFWWRGEAMHFFGKISRIADEHVD